jgi:hypothetical protein
MEKFEENLFYSILIQKIETMSEIIMSKIKIIYRKF